MSKSSLRRSSPQSAKSVPHPILVIVSGAPASGKGTISEHLIADVGLYQISTGDLLREEISKGSEIGEQAMKLMRAGRLVPESIVNTMVFNKLETPEVRQRGAILDGFPRTESQALALEAYCRSSGWWKLDALITLDVPDEVLLERSAGRRIDPVTKQVYHVKFNPPPKEIENRLKIRDDDQPDRCRRRIATYKENTALIEAVFSDKIVHINGNQPMQNVYQDFVVKMAASCWGEKSGRSVSTIPEKWKVMLMKKKNQQASKL